MKRTLCLILTLALLLLSACSTKPTEEPSSTTQEPSSQQEATCTPVLYKVSAENGAVLYLFGSIHVTDSRAYPLPDYVMQAYEESDYLAVECDVNAFTSDFAAQQELVTKMVLTDGTTVADHLGQDVYEAAKAFLSERGAYFQIYDSYHPAMWMSLLEAEVADMSGLDPNGGIDMYFLTLAAQEGKEIREVESVEYQYDLLLGFSDELLSLIVGDCAQDPQEQADGTKALYEFWLAGDEDSLVQLLNEQPEEENAALYAEYETALITERNGNMADTAEEYLKQGGTGFFVVGAAHILGDGACADLLAERGYTVERIG